MRRCSLGLLRLSDYNSSCPVFNQSFVCWVSIRLKGDYGFNVFHNSNPQHGGSYARHERRMRDDEVEDFLKSVKGWIPVDESVPSVSSQREETNENNETQTVSVDEAPAVQTIFTGEEAIKRTFVFDCYGDAYLFMGRVWAFCYGSDKYPHVTWDRTSVTVYLYSPSFRGLSKREACLAAFLNDQYNMFKKSKRQQEKLLKNVVQQAVVEEQAGDHVAELLRRREEERRRPLKELIRGPESWEVLLREEGKK